MSISKKIVNNKKRILLTVIALIEIIVLLVSVTYSWIPTKKNATVSSGETLSITADAGLKIQYKNSYNGIADIGNTTLYQASSIDGRRIFFPTIGGIKSNNNTTEMCFREGAVNDVNSRYISVDFTIRADDAQQGAYMPIWFDGNNTYVKHNNSTYNTDAIRVAFYENNGEAPQVFAPNVSSGQTRTVTAVESVNLGSGAPQTAEQTAKSFETNYFINESNTSNALFLLNPNEVKHITMIVWLEGADPKCTKNLLGKDLEISVNLKGATLPQQSITQPSDDETIRIFFENKYSWDIDTSVNATAGNPTAINIYYWGHIGSDDVDNLAFPGLVMKEYVVQGSSKQYYYADIPADVTGVIISQAGYDGDNRIEIDATSKNETYMNYDDGLIKDKMVFFFVPPTNDKERSKGWYQGPPNNKLKE